MEYVNCLLCGGESHHTIFDLKDREEKIVKCDACGFVFKNPRLSAEELDRIFQEHPGDQYDSYLERKKGDFVRYLDEIEHYHKGRGTLLDVGASYGLFLALARERGWHVEGVETCEPEVKYAKSKFGIDLRYGDLFQAQFPSDRFDVVALFEVLEHILYPKTTLSEVYRILKPGGMACILVPNIENPKTEEHDYYNVFHVSHFSEETLQKMAVECHFKMLKTLINPTFPFSHNGYLRTFVSRHGRPAIRIVRRLLSSPAGKKMMSTGRIPQGGITLLATKDE